jgi:uncharacterized Zn finger protein
MGRKLFRNKRSKGPPGFWKDRLRHSFLPVIRQRGEYYAEQGKAILKEVSQERILAAVQGSKLYTATVVDRHSGDGKIHVSCTCPFFQQGFPCKHLWAAIVEADRLTDIQETAKFTFPVPAPFFNRVFPANTYGQP